jgi:hypothetical protein
MFPFTVLSRAVFNMHSKPLFSRLRDQIYFGHDHSAILNALDERRGGKILNPFHLHEPAEVKHPFENIDVNKPLGVLSRSIASPNYEQLHFLHICRKYNLQPVILEYNGKFVTFNKEKFYSARMHFSETPTDPTTHKQDLIYINENQGKNMHDISTKWGEKLIDFHHSLFKQIDNVDTPIIINFTDWFNSVRYLDKKYYFYFLSLFLKNAVLFDNYDLGDKREFDFTVEKIIPSLNEVVDQFQCKPLIFPLVPFEQEENYAWLGYPIHLRPVVLSHLKI